VADQETGLFYNGMRDYNPRTGRYLEPDPIGLEGGLSRYAYVGGNPLTYVDPLGLDPKDTYVDPMLNLADRVAGVPSTSRSPTPVNYDFLSAMFPATTAYIVTNPIGGSANSQIDYANMVNSGDRAALGALGLTIAPMGLPEGVTAPLLTGMAMRSVINKGADYSSRSCTKP
jgi:RHS repeat-associated protein